MPRRANSDPELAAAQKAAAGTLSRQQQLAEDILKGRRGALIGANLSGINLAGVDLTGVSLTGSFGEGIDLSSARLTRSWLQGANWSKVKLTGADLTGALVNWLTQLKVSLDGWAMSAVAFPVADDPEAEPRPQMVTGCVFIDGERVEGKDLADRMKPATVTLVGAEEMGE